MEEAQIRIQQMQEQEDKGFTVDKKIHQTEDTHSVVSVEKEQIKEEQINESNVVYIDKNELKDNPQNILNIENSVVYISSSSRAPSPSPTHQEQEQGPPSLGTQSLPSTSHSQDDHVNNMFMYNLKKYNTV